MCESVTQWRCLKDIFGLNKQKGFHPNFIQFLETCGESLENSLVNLPRGGGGGGKSKSLLLE